MKQPIKDKAIVHKAVLDVPDKVANELNDKQKAFVRAYCYDWRAPEAYMKVYGVEDREVARAAASRLLSYVTVQRYVQYCRDHVEELVHISKAMMVNELKKIALSNITDIYDDWIKLKDYNELTEDQKASIQTIESTTRTEIVNGSPTKVDWIKVKLHSKQAAIEAINKTQGYNAKEDINITVNHNNLAEVSTQELLQRSKAIKEIANE